ncbi:MAG: DUF1549 domain-containing protein [Planctomycetota bacterium]|nr:MAG: DUF1549 domain-containing protein [Planctomycetota bacterium]
MSALLSAVIATLSPAPAFGGQDSISFVRDVRPILAEHCFACHGPDEGQRQAELRFDRAEDFTRDLGGYRAVVPGEPEESELYLLVTADEAERMPPRKAGERLARESIDVLRRWIEAGGVWEPHWAYAPFRTIAAPEVADESWVRNPIDRFVLARLERDGIAPAPEADRRTLIRRVALDLVGLPPAPEEVAAFLADDGRGAYGRVVDRLLASPHYGERWARHWLDLARYADSHGFTIDQGRSMWPYRDWVVDAINADLPFDRFTIEQLAGDLLPEPTNAQLVATGFHRNTQINQEGGAKDEENRVNAVIDRVNTTGAVWLGSTVGCAQCHSHKFDPLTQIEYYQLFAFFNQTMDGGVTLGPTTFVSDESTWEWLARYEAGKVGLERALHEAETAAAVGWTLFEPDVARGENGPELLLEADGSLLSVGQNPQTSVYTLEGPVPGGAGEGGVGAVRIEALPSHGLKASGPGRSGSGNFVISRVRVYARADGEDAAWRELELASASADFEQDTRSTGGGHYPATGVLVDEERTGWAVSPRFGEPHVLVVTFAEPLRASDRRVRLELHQSFGSQHVLGRFRIRLGAARGVPHVPRAWPAAWTALEEHGKTRPSLPTSMVMRERAAPRTTRLFRRGSFLDPGERVEPGFPEAWNHFALDAVPRTRLDLARWLGHGENALAHRVTVNRWWQQLFGLGLVATENDFGLRGAAPSHPDLLEWLAREHVRLGFSRKALHRVIVTSATYRQSSTPRPKLSDPRNRKLARQARLRIDAECVRDAALVASGLLQAKLGGPPVQPPQPDGVFAFTQSVKNWLPSEGEDRYRRTLYTRIWRSSTYPFLTTFDAPAANVTCTRRIRSNTALQALVLANDAMMMELARGLARRVMAEAEDDRARIQRAFEVCLSRPPDAAEEALVARHVAGERRRHTVAGAAPEEVERRTWTAVARVLFNLDEFVTRN